jgi:predicted hotdog family 3-hydroxylacyl-ACP dehydratase
LRRGGSASACPAARRQAALLFDLLHDARAQHFEQARHHHHDGGAHFLDIAAQLVQTFGIEDLAAQPMGRNWPAVCS